MQLVLSLLGTGIGLSTVDPLRYSTPDASTLGMGAGIWFVVSSVIALFTGGWVAGRIDGAMLAIDGVAVVRAQQPAIAVPAGGTTVDSEGRAAINAILNTLRTHGLIGS